MHVQIFTVYTELMLSVHRADCERATHPTPVEGEVRFFQAQDQPSVTTHIRVGNRVFSHSLDVVSKMHIYTLYTVIFSPAQYQKRYLRSKITKPSRKVRDPKIISADVSIF